MESQPTILKRTYATPNPRWIILLIIFFDVVSLGLVTPLLSPLLLDESYGFLDPNTPASYRGILFGLIMALHTIFQFVCAPVLGSLSDKFGRKKILLFAIASMTVCYCIGGMGIYRRDILLLVVYRVLSGIGAGNSPVMQAAMADVSSDKEKTKNFGLIGASIGAGLVFGPFLIAKLLESSKPSLLYSATIFWFASFLALGNFCLVYFFLHNTAPAANNSEVTQKSPQENWRKILKQPQIGLFLIGMSLYFIAWDLFYVLLPVFLIYHLHFEASQIGYFYSFMGLCSVFSNAVILRLLSNLNPLSILKFILPVWGVYLSFLYFIDDVQTFWYYLPVLPTLGALITSCSAAFISSLASKESQGQILGIYQSVQSISMTIPTLVLAPWVAKYPFFVVIGGSVFSFLSGNFMWVQGWWLQKKDKSTS